MVVDGRMGELSADAPDPIPAVARHPMGNLSRALAPRHQNGEKECEIWSRSDRLSTI